MGVPPRTCGQCEHLKRTSPTQVFLLCKWWSAPNHGMADYGLTCTHCHLQPEAPACVAFKPRRKEVLAA